MNYQSGRGQRCGQQTQATGWLDTHVWQKYEIQMEEMQKQLHDTQSGLLGAVAVHTGKMPEKLQFVGSAMMKGPFLNFT